MSMKCIIILISVLLSIVPLTGSVVMSKAGACGSGTTYHETWFLGSNEETLKYHKYGGGTVDDGLFVAIPDGGRYGGYSYYEMQHPVTGVIDGGPAYLPLNPGNFPVSGFYAVAQGHYMDKRPNFARAWRGRLPELADGSVIPIGSKFFYWMSRGGSFSLTAAVLESMSSTPKTLTVRTQAIPYGETAQRWFEPSETISKDFTIRKR